MTWKIVESKTDDEWLAEVVAATLDAPAPALPPAHQRIGNSTATWFECEPGIAFIHTKQGSSDDRLLAELVVREQLRGHNIKQATYWIDGALDDDDFRKTADWSDIEAKAKRLIQSGQVQMLRNNREQAVAMVQGDHGQYQTEISREDPKSRAITQWQCDCPWDQYAWQRTRQWKKYEGRPCAHVLAVHWMSQNAPLEEDQDPAAQGQLFAPPAANPMTKPSPFTAPMPQQQGQQMQIPGMFPGQATGTPPMPGTMPPPGPVIAPPGVIPPNPYDPANMPPPEAVPNPASVPGLRQPSPTNPVQFPGGTFSSVQTDDWNFDTLPRMAAQPEGFVNGNIVSTKQEDWGTYIGRSEEHGSGQQAKIPAKSVGEVLGQDPTTGMVNVLFENKMTEKMGPLQPNGVVAWFFPSELDLRPDVRRPGPAVRRR